MKKLLTAIVAASFLALGAGGYADKKDTKEYEDCIKKYENLVPGKDYKRGEFLMIFDEKISKQEAEEFIENHDFCDELEMQQKFYQYDGPLDFAVVKVPEGKELEYICYFDSLKDDTIVKHAEPNLIIRTKKFPY